MTKPIEEIVTVIPTELEPKPWEPCRENCAGCRTPTRRWTRLPERKPGEQVALCENCANTMKLEEIPTKTAWCEKERALMPSWARHFNSPWAFTGSGKESK